MQINKTWVVIACISFNIGSISYAFVTNSMNNALETLYLVFNVQNKSLFAGALTVLPMLVLLWEPQLQPLQDDIFLFIGSTMLIFDNVVIFFAGRVIAGIGCGMCAVCQPVFIREFSPTEMYSSMGGILSTVFSFGYFLTMLYGVWFPSTEQIDDNFWRIYFFVGGIPSFIRIIVMNTIYKFQTPVYYIQNNQQQEALKVLAKIYVTDDYEELLENIKKQSQSKDHLTTLQTITKYKKQFIFGLFIMFIFQFCGFNAVVQYSTSIFKKSTTQKTAQLLSFFISILKWVLYSFAGTFTLKYYGRRKPLILGLFFMLIANCGIFIFSFYEHDYIIIAFIFLFVFANFSSTGPIVPVYLPEFVPQLLISYCYYTFWAYSIIILLIFPLAVDLLGMANCFIFFASITGIGLVVFYKFGVETMNKTNYEIYSMFTKVSSLVQQE